MNEKLNHRLQVTNNSIEDKTKQLYLGKKLQVFIERFNSKSKKNSVNDLLMDEIKRMIIIEKSKQSSKIITEVKYKSEDKPMKEKQIEEQKILDKIKVGSKVSILSTRQIGIVDRIKGDDVYLEIGNIKMKIKKSKLLLLD